MLKTQQLFDPYGHLAYRESGQGEPIIFLHGVGMHSEAWTPQIDAFCDGMRTIALDMPGHGESSALPKGAELQDFVEWLYEALDKLELGPVNLVGHSMGALIAGGFSVKYPELVRRVAVLNGIYCRSQKARAAVEARAAEIELGKVDLETPIKRWFGDSDTDSEACRLVLKILASVDMDGYAIAYRAFAQGDQTYAAGWANVRCPMLALTGDGDPNSTPEMSKAMARAALNGHVEILAGQRHMINLTAPSKVNAILSLWLSTPVDKKE